MPDPIDFRAVVREAMARRGWSPAETARRAEIASSQLYHYLAEQRGLGDVALARLLTALGVTVRLPRAAQTR